MVANFFYYSETRYYVASKHLIDFERLMSASHSEINRQNLRRESVCPTMQRDEHVLSQTVTMAINTAAGSEKYCLNR